MTVISEMFGLLEEGTGFVNPIDTSASGSSITESSQALDLLLGDSAKMDILKQTGIMEEDIQNLQTALNKAQSSCNELSNHVGEGIGNMQSRLAMATSYTGMMKKMGNLVEPCSASSSIFGMALGQGVLFISSIGETASALADLVNSEIENVQQWVSKFNGLVASVVSFPGSVQSAISDEISALNKILESCINGAFANSMAALFGEECSKAVIGTLASPEMSDLLNQL